MTALLSRPICLVTRGSARRHDDPAAHALVSLAAQASAAGVDIVQLREPSLPDGDLLRLARRLLAEIDRSRTALLVNDRADVAMAAGADGVHLRADAMHASRVRSIVPPGFLIGRSVHTAAEARAAEQDGGVDYLMFGTVFATASKPADHPVGGLSLLADVCAQVRVPVIAIGGMTPERAAQAAGAGAAGIAAIGLFADADAVGIPSLVRQLRHAIDTGSRVV